LAGHRAAILFKRILWKMHIFVDADACPVVGIVEAIAEKYNTR